MYLYFVLIG